MTEVFSTPAGIMRITAVLFIAAALSVMMCSPVQAEEIAVVDGHAGIVADGDLSDWARYDSERFEVPVISVVGKRGVSDSVSVSIRCVADDGFIYVSAEVYDETPVYKNDIYNIQSDGLIVFFCDKNAFNVHMYAYSSSTWDAAVPHVSQASLSLSVSSDTEGNTLPMFRFGFRQFPYLCEELGVQSVFKRNGGWYTVEAAIPLHMLNIALPGNRAVENIYFVINDGHEISLLNRFMRSQNIDLGPLIISGEDGEPVFQKQDAVDGFKSPPRTASEAIHTFLTYYNANELNKAEEVLVSYGDAQWINPALSILYQATGKFDEAIVVLNKIAEESPDMSVRLQAKKDLAGILRIRKKDDDAAAEIYKELLMSANPDLYGEALYFLIRAAFEKEYDEEAFGLYEQAADKHLFDTHWYFAIADQFAGNGHGAFAADMHENAISYSSNLPPHIHYKIMDVAIEGILWISARIGKTREGFETVNKILDTYPGFPSSPKFASTLENAGEYDYALEMYEEYIQSGDDEIEIISARSGIARCHYFMGNYDDAFRLAGEMIDENLTPVEDTLYNKRIIERVGFDARLLRFLIYRERILHKIYIALFAGMILIVVLRKYMKKYRKVQSA
ncbi:hypothetical protein ACFL6H_02745 [Candidatus Latescibacterota bacterium]